MQAEPVRKLPAVPSIVNELQLPDRHLGGFLARKGDPKPIWLDLQRVMDAVAAIQTLLDEAA